MDAIIQDISRAVELLQSKEPQSKFIFYLPFPDGWRIFEASPEEACAMAKKEWEEKLKEGRNGGRP